MGELMLHYQTDPSRSSLSTFSTSLPLSFGTRLTPIATALNWVPLEYNLWLGAVRERAATHRAPASSLRGLLALGCWWWWQGFFRGSFEPPRMRGI